MAILDHVIGIGCQRHHHIIGVAASVSLREEIQAAMDYFGGEGRERLMEGVSHCIREIH